MVLAFLGQVRRHVCVIIVVMQDPPLYLDLLLSRDGGGTLGLYAESAYTCCTGGVDKPLTLLCLDSLGSRDPSATCLSHFKSQTRP